jgi:hypothetical protein
MTSIIRTYFTSAREHLLRLLGPQQRPTLHLDIPDTCHGLERLNQHIADELRHLEEPIHFARRPSPTTDTLSQIDGTVYATPEGEETIYFANILPFANETNNHISIDLSRTSMATTDDPLPFARAGLDSPDWTIDSLLAPSREIYWIPHTTTVPPEPSPFQQMTVNNILSSKADQRDTTLSTPSTSSSEETEVLVHTWQQRYINHGVTTKFYIPPHQRAMTTPDGPIAGEVMSEDWTPMPQDWNIQTNMTQRNFNGQCYRCKVGIIRN